MRDAGEAEVGQRTEGRAEERAERGRCCERTRRMSAMVQSQTSGCWICRGDGHQYLYVMSAEKLAVERGHVGEAHSRKGTWGYVKKPDE